MTALVVPLWNQWEYTELFLKSLEGAAPAGSYKLILVDNGSNDKTRTGLLQWKKRLKFTLIRNKKNLGCAPAWNQGVKAALKSGSDWIGVLNNDLILAPGTLARLVARAEARGWDLVSPATREGELNYDFERYADDYTRRCQGRDEAGWFGWCFLVRASVFAELGFFDESFKLGIGEDEDFARRMAAKGKRLGITGCAFVHHFGSKTLNVLRQKSGRSFEEENLKKLRARWGAPSSRTPLSKLFDSLRRGYSRLRWGHLIKE